MKSERILVMDDERPMLHAVQRVLSPHYTVFATASAQQALAVAEREPLDLAILDIRMPDSDGFAIMEQFRKLRPTTDVLFMTGNLHELDAQLLRAIREKAFYFIQKPFDREVLLALVERCFELRRLSAKESAHLRQIEAELEHARRFQRSLMPDESAEVAGRAVHLRFRPSAEVGGDLVDHVAIGPRKAAVLAADVSGHGVSAAMLTGIVKSVFHDAHVVEFAPDAIVKRLARALKPFDASMFVTLFVARLDDGAAKLEYVNAGHPPALVLGRGRPIEELGETGPVVSPAIDDARWTPRTIPFKPADRLLLLTDGILEARGPAGAMFGAERLRAWADARPPTGGAALDGLLQLVHKFTGDRRQEDDQCLLLVEGK